MAAALIAAGAATLAPARAQMDLAPRPVPAKLLPVPNTVSPAMRGLIAAPPPSGWDTIPQTPEAWRRLAAQSAAEVMPHLPALRAHLGVSVESATMAGVRVYVVTPNTLPPENRDRLLIHVHGGGYVLYPGEAGAGEAMLMAGFGRFKVISVDYGQLVLAGRNAAKVLEAAEHARDGIAAASHAHAAVQLGRSRRRASPPERLVGRAPPDVPAATQRPAEAERRPRPP